MGLDSVELVIRFEEEFGIEISDDDAARMATPRDVAEYICTRIELHPPPGCLTQQAYFRIRSAMQAQGVARKSLRPKVQFATVYAEQERGRCWADLKARLNARHWPGLHRPWLHPTQLTFRRGCETIGGLARHIATWDVRVPSGRDARWWKEAVLLRVRQITTEETGVKTFNDNDHYIDDLHID